MEPSRTRPPVLDMTPEGEFREPPAPSGFDRALGRIGGAALLIAIGCAGLALAAVAVLAIGVLLPVALAAGAIGAGSLWWRARRNPGGVRFVVMRR